MKVPFYDFSKVHNSTFQNEIIKEMQEIIAENAFIDGAVNKEVEDTFASSHNARFGLLTANGTDAIEISLVASGIKNGDKVIVPSVSFHASAEAVLNVGAEPVFCDIEPSTGLMCIESIMEILSQVKEIKAILPVHLYGHPFDTDALLKCIQNDILVIEDAAQAHGADLSSFKKELPNAIATFSFYPTKNIGAFGDAGIILLNNEETFHRVKEIRNHGRSLTGIKAAGRNSRCDQLQALVIRKKLKNLDLITYKRREIAKSYMTHLKDLPLTFVGANLQEDSAWHLFPILLPLSTDRETFVNYLNESGIGYSLFYDKTLPDFPIYSNFFSKSEKAVEYTSRVVCLPIYQDLSSEQVNYVIDKVKNFFK